MTGKARFDSVTALISFGVILIIAVFCICLIIYKGEKAPTFGVADFWSVFGVLLSGIGLLLSAFAAYGVFVLSKQNHIKGRLRDFSSDLPSLVDEITKSADKNFMSLRQKGLLGRVKPSMLSLSMVDSGYFKNVTDDVTNSLSEFEKIASLGDANKKVNEYGEFWEFHKALTAVVDTIKNYSKDKGMA